MKMGNLIRLAGASVLVLTAAACGSSASSGSAAPQATDSNAPQATATAAATTAPASSPQGFAANIHWLRSTNEVAHVSIQIQTGDLVIYLDPVKLVNLDKLPKADIILVTHDHADHMSIDDIEALSKPETQVVVFDGLVGGSFKNTVPVSAGKTVDVLGVAVTGVAAYNEFHPQGLGYLGFVIETAGVRVYCSGDSGLTPEMLALKDIDIALLNYYSPYVISPGAAIEFAEKVQPSVIIPIHWKPEDTTRPEAASLADLPSRLPATVKLVVLPLE